MYQHELEAIGERIEELRKGKGWTQEMLAERLNIARNTLTKLEGGFRDFKSTELLNIAKALEVSTDYLLGLTTVSRPDITLRETSERYGLSEAALNELSIISGEGSVMHANEYIDTLMLREIVNLLLSNAHGRKALIFLHHFYHGKPLLKNQETHIDLGNPFWKLKGGVHISDIIPISVELIRDALINIAINELKALYRETAGGADND